MQSDFQIYTIGLDAKTLFSSHGNHNRRFESLILLAITQLPMHIYAYFLVSGSIDYAAMHNPLIKSFLNDIVLKANHGVTLVTFG